MRDVDGIGRGALGALVVVAGLALGAPAGVLAQPAPPTAEALAPYIGDWVNETRQGPGGRAFHYRYTLRWLDEGGRIAEMVIERRYEDGETILSWRGYKGWDAAEEEGFYYGFSPSGRWSRGTFERRDSTLVTAYTGYTAEGDSVQIRDVFHPVRDGVRFLAVTYMHRGGEWREILRDEWRRRSE